MLIELKTFFYGIKVVKLLLALGVAAKVREVFTSKGAAKKRETRLQLAGASSLGK
ncbi:MAG: hypothetical protein GF334_01720 [Candidatus Altiarchaeales archaeon]|nr:hypothetical protein [Candidatus Altiarchaeales archaeon]